jgi:hypothetical protein
MRQLLTLTIMLGVLGLGLAPAAAAAAPGTAPGTVPVTAPGPRQVTPFECLAAYDDDDLDYVGEGWVGNLVSGPPPTSWWIDLFDETDRDYNLHCGDELTGVVHIATQEGTGTGHLIDADDEQWFLDCWKLTVGDGRAEPDSTPGRTKFTKDFGGDRQSVVIVDDKRRFTYTMYTTGDRSNDWLPCIVVRA